MIVREVKLRPTKKQEATLNNWLWHLTGVYNWAIRKIELDAQGGIYYTKQGFQNLLADHGKVLGIPSHTLQAVLVQAHDAWTRCFKKLAKKPRLKGRRNKLISIPFPDPIKPSKDNKISIPSFKGFRFHKQELPEGKIKRGRIVKRASGWYLQLTIDAERIIERKDNNIIGIDPGFKDLLTLSNGRKIENPKEYDNGLRRLGQAQRGRNKKLIARLHERIKNQKKDRNHKLSRELVENNIKIFFSKDNIKGIQKKFGKSVSNANHYQLRQMLKYKSSLCGTEYIEVGSKGSTLTCSDCGARSGPTGFTGLSVREWVCTSCGVIHDRDVNAAINTLIIGLGMSHEEYQHVA